VLLAVAYHWNRRDWNYRLLFRLCLWLFNIEFQRRSACGTAIADCLGLFKRRDHYLRR
jgi:hypothetical protein